jgi:hypothetical protein
VWENRLLMTEKGNKRCSGAAGAEERVINDADGGELSGVADRSLRSSQYRQSRLAVRHPIIWIL